MTKAERRIKGIEKKIRQRVEKSLEQGYLLRFGGNTQYGAHVCLMGALAPVAHDIPGPFGPVDVDPDRRKKIAPRYGMTYYERVNLERGFEGWDQLVGDPENDPFFQMGARIRKDFCEWTS